MQIEDVWDFCNGVTNHKHFSWSFDGDAWNARNINKHTYTQGISISTQLYLQFCNISGIGYIYSITFSTCFFGCLLSWFTNLFNWQIEKVLCHSALVLCGLHCSSHATPVLQTRHCPALYYQINYEVVTMCYQWIYVSAPISKYWKPKNTRA